MNNPKLKQFLQKLDSKQGRQIVMALTALIAGYCIFQIIMPARDKANQIKEQTVGVQNSLKTAEAEYKQLLPKLQNTKTKDLSASLNKAMPSDIGDGSGLYRLLNNLAQQVGVDNPIPSFQPGAPTEGSNYRTVPVSLTIKGSYSNCLRFLNGLYNMVQIRKNSVQAVGPLWQVQTVSLASDNPSVATMSLTSNMYLSPSAPQGKTDGTSGSSSGGTG